jgi:ketosteroid isomerase-like protein
MPTTKTKPDLSVQTTDHPNAIQLRDAFAAFSRGDLDAVRANFTEDATWTNAGSSALSGSYSGWDEISGMFGKLFDLTAGTFSMNVISTVADDRFAVAVYDATSTINGKTDTQRFVLADEMTGDRKVTSIHSMAFDQAAADAHANG